MNNGKFSATINGWPAKVEDNNDGTITITAETLGFTITNGNYGRS